MQKHLSFEEIIELAGIKRLERKDAVRIGVALSHFAQCDECRRIYDAAVALEQSMGNISKEESYAAAKRLRAEFNADARADHGIKVGCLSIMIQIGNLTKQASKILLKTIHQTGELPFEFVYPINLASRAAGQGKGTDKAKIIDEYDNRNIIFVNERDLNIQIAKERYKKAPIFQIIDAQGEISVNGKLSLEREYWTADIKNLPVGDYTLNMSEE